MLTLREALRRCANDGRDISAFVWKQRRWSAANRAAIRVALSSDVEIDDLIDCFGIPRGRLVEWGRRAALAHRKKR